MSSLIKGLLIDLDGVIYNDSQIIPGAVETIHKLRQQNIPFRFITNTTMKCRDTLRKKLNNFGIDCETKEIFSAAYAAAKYVSQYPEAKCHLMLKEDAKKEFVESASDDEKVNFVVAGDLGDTVTFELLNNAFVRLMNGAKLIALQKNRFWLSDQGYTLDAGAFIALLEYASNQEAILIGKPERNFFELALADLDLLPDNVLMIGDDIESDIGGAVRINTHTCLVRTGKFRKQDVENSDIKPDHIISSIADIFSLELF
ncbi:MAG: TIGR01458 family HAD-type hydrolase [Calditrichaceae bacterium]